jgi:hypothetical protein
MNHIPHSNREFHGIHPRRLFFAAMIFAAAASIASATEKGGSVWPIGAETFGTAAGVPHAGQTLFYQYTCFYVANELDDGKGHDSGVPQFKLRALGMAGKLSHNWGVKVLGGEWGSYIAIPEVFEQFSVNGVQVNKNAISNIDITPITIFNHKGMVHWYYELQFESAATAYEKGATLNIGQNNIAFTPGAAITLTPHKGQQNIMSRVDYIINDADHATHYHSGNEFFWQFDAQQALPRSRATVGVCGYFYQQTTRDTQSGWAVVTSNADGTQSTGYKGREMEIGPQATFPLGKHGAIIVKWDHDTLVQNKPRGNAFWFELGVPFSYLHHGAH